SSTRGWSATTPTPSCPARSATSPSRRIAPPTALRSRGSPTCASATRSWSKHPTAGTPTASAPSSTCGRMPSRCCSRCRRRPRPWPPTATSRSPAARRGTPMPSASSPTGCSSPFSRVPPAPPPRSRRWGTPVVLGTVADLPRPVVGAVAHPPRAAGGRALRPVLVRLPLGEPVREPAGGHGRMTRVLVVDNRDSFVHTLIGYLRELGADVEVVEADESGDGPSGAGAVIAGFDAVMVSPGPGTPGGAGAWVDVVRAGAEGGMPLLGVCRGHQAIATAFGARVGHAPELMHGMVSAVHHDGSALYDGLPDP